MEKFAGGWSLGRTTYQFDGMGDVALNAWHQDQVLSLPDGAKVVGSSAFCANAALLYEGRALTIQPHPEFDGALIGDYVRLRRGTADYEDDRMEAAANSASLPVDQPLFARQIAKFFNDNAKRSEIRHAG